jgi:tetratricopeptide (TPR) repeat protein
LFLLAGIVIALPTPQEATKTAPAAAPAQLFQRGQAALDRGDLNAAEDDFRGVLRLDPEAGAAYANLGVVYMRRKQWDQALAMLQKAAKKLPQLTGVRLNIGLAYFRQNEFLQAIPPLESVVRDQPDALQPRYLLGLCYFFADHWADAAATLEPLWDQESQHFPYLYVLSNAAHRAGRQDLDDRAAAQLIKLGNGSAEYHLFAGKYHLNLDQYDRAIAEFEAAAAVDPRLPFVHFNLGFAHLKKQELAQARDEFLKDAQVEPDLGLNYDELGEVYWLMQDDKNAESSYREALRLDPRLVNSRLGLARIYQRQQKYSRAIEQLDVALKVDPARTEVHYVRGQVLLHLGRKDEAKKEMEAAAHHEEKQPSNVPSPELLQDSQ